MPQSFFDVRGIFDGDAARELTVAVRARNSECVIDFAHADPMLHALGALVLGLDAGAMAARVRIRGLTIHQLSIIRSLGFLVDAHGRVTRAPHA